MQYYSYYLQIRDLGKITINNYCQLFKLYVTDMWCKIELQRLSFLSFSRKYVLSVIKLFDAFMSDKSGLSNIGKRIILPSSFKGGPRHLYKLFQSSIELYRNFKNKYRSR